MSPSNTHAYTPLAELARPREPRPGIALRVRVLLAQRRLDRALAREVDPRDSAELALRARQITRAPYRHTLADSYDEVLCIAEGQGSRVAASPPLASRDVRACRAALLELAHELRRDGEVRVLGVALAQELLTDAHGPLYVTSSEGELRRALERAHSLL
jgi:hypothetical protein